MRVALGFAVVVQLLCRPVRADPYDVGPWSVEVEPMRAVAALNDPAGLSTLFVRCVEGHVDVLVRPRAAPMTEQADIRHFAGSLRADGGVAVDFPAQTWSLGGTLIPDADPILPRIEAGQKLDFTFVDGDGSSSMSFLASDTRQALRPVRQPCEAAAS